jgi:hypothetical protein
MEKERLRERHGNLSKEKWEALQREIMFPQKAILLQYQKEEPANETHHEEIYHTPDV